MNTRDNGPFHAAINASLASIVEVSPAALPWYGAWMGLDSESTEEERLSVYQAVRDAGSLPEEAGFYLVAWQIDYMTSLEAATRLRDLDDRMAAIKAEHGLEELDPWPSDKIPAEYEALWQQHEQAWDELYARKLAAFGEHEVARLFCSDREQFQRRVEAGRTFFHRPQEPEDSEDEEEAWVHELLEAVASCMTGDCPAGPLRFRYGEDDGLWEIDLYPTPVELVGGAEDGEIVAPGFSLDLEELRTVFEHIDALAWQSLGFPGGPGPHVVVEGSYQGHDVFLQILAYAPEDEEPGMKLDTGRRTL